MWGTLRGTTVNHQCNIVCALLHQRKQNPIFYCEDFLCFLKGKKTKSNQGKKKKKKNALKIAFAAKTKHVLLFIHFFFSQKRMSLLFGFSICACRAIQRFH